MWVDSSSMSLRSQLSGLLWRCRLIERVGERPVRTYLESEQPQGTILLCINDCAPALAALQKGSSKPNLQAATEQLHIDCIRAGQFPMFLHVSGESLVSDGVDDGSRTKARSLRGPRSGAWLWEEAQQLASAVGWTMTVDMFAAACNAKLPRFMTWTDEAGSEQVDAFAARTWDPSECPGRSCVGRKWAASRQSSWRSRRRSSRS